MNEVQIKVPLSTKNGIEIMQTLGRLNRMQKLFQKHISQRRAQLPSTHTDAGQIALLEKADSFRQWIAKGIMNAEMEF